MSNLADECKNYMGHTMPHFAGEVQKEETEKAFMAGALVTLGLIMQADSPEEMDKIAAEANAYAVAQIAKGDKPKILLS
jgi:hypothetical protein